MTFDADFKDSNQKIDAEFGTVQYVGTGGVQPPRIVEVNLLADAWAGDVSPYSQVVEVPSVTEFSKVDLQPSVEQLELFHDKDLAFSTENDGGVITVFAVGDKPTRDYTIQATITEVEVWQ